MARSVLPVSNASFSAGNETVKRRRSLADMIDTHLHLRQGLRRYKSRNELQDDQKSRDCEVQAPHCPPPKPLVIKPSGSLDIEFVSHSSALGPKEILHKTSQVGPLGAEKAVQYTAQKPYVHHRENYQKTKPDPVRETSAWERSKMTPASRALFPENPSEEQCNPLIRETGDDVVASERNDETDLMSSEPAMVMKNITSHELNQELPASASELAEQFVEPSDSPLEEPQAVTVVSKNDKGAAASKSADRLDDNASTASLPTGSAEEDTAGVLTPIGADRPTDDHWEYNVDTKTGRVCFKRVPGPPEPWVISKQLVLNLLATGLPEAGSKDAQAWDQYNKKLREKKGLVAVPNASSLRIPASNQLSRKSSIHRQQGRLRAVHPRHPPKCHADQEKEFFRGSIEPVETSSSAANMESMTKSDNRN